MECPSVASWSMSMAARLRMRWRVVSQSFERPVRVLIGSLVLAVASAGHAGETKLPSPPAPSSAAPSQIAKPSPTVALNPSVYFKYFQYDGHDAVFDQPASPG